jgi:hypothetical protein
LENISAHCCIKLLVYGANGASIPILDIGSAVIHATTGPIVIHEAFYAPDLLNSLVPITYYICRGYSVSLIRDGLGYVCQRPGHTLCTGRTTKGVLLIDLQTPQALSVKDPNQSYLDLHRALGHPSLTYLKKSFPDLSIPNIECSVCDVSKMHRQPFSGSFPIATKPLEITHMDLCGPMSPPSWEGNFYFLKIINGYSKYHFIFPIKLKSDMFQTFSMFLSKVENASGHKLISVESDNGGEFVNNSFQSLFAAKRIKYLTSAPYTPQQNPFAKRGN